MSETQHHYLQQGQAHFIQSGTRSVKVYLNELLTASDSTNREDAKAHALWPLLLCVAVALRRRLVLVVCFLYVCGVVLCCVCWWLSCLWRVVLCSWWCVCVCFFGCVCVCVLFLLVLFMVVCVVFLALVFMEFLMALSERQWFHWASHETPNKTTVAQFTPSRNVCTFCNKHLSSHCEPLKAT